MQDQAYQRCQQCNRMTLHVKGGPYSMPREAHLLAIIALTLVFHPMAGLAWAGVWAVHELGNIGAGRAAWICIQCGAGTPPPPPLPPFKR